MDRYRWINFHSHEWKPFSLPHLIFIIIFFSTLIFIYLLPKFFSKDKKNIILWTLFVLQLGLFIFYELDWIMCYVYSKNKGLGKLNDFINIFPLDYCRVTEVLSLLIILFRNNKFFSIVCIYPIIGSTLAVFVPSYGPTLGSYDYWYYYVYFISHILSLAIPVYMFRYNLRLFHKKYFKWSIFTLAVFSLFIIILNWQLGRDDMELSPDFRAGPIDFKKWLHNSDPKFNDALGGALNLMFIVLVMGLFGNWLGWLFYRFQKPYKIKLKKENIKVKTK